MVQFEEDGYLILPGFFSPETATKLLDRCVFSLCSHRSPAACAPPSDTFPPSMPRIYPRSSSAKELLNEFSLDGHPMTVFATTAEEKHVGDAYFLESGDKVRCFPP